MTRTKHILLSIVGALACVLAACTVDRQADETARSSSRMARMMATSRPAAFTVAFFQPIRYLPKLASLGINTFCGPEVENARTIPPAVLAQKRLEWVEETRRLGVYCILKGWEGPLPDNCIGVLTKIDEPNRNQTGPSDELKAEVAQLRSQYPGVPIYISLAGDKVSSANFTPGHRDRAAYVQYGEIADFFFTNFYEKNRNADRYPDTMSGDIALKLYTATSRPTIPFFEINDQQLPRPPPPATNRAPTTQEVRAKVAHSRRIGVQHVGWFFTQDRGLYGWPDSYFPQVDRSGVSMVPLYEEMAKINFELAPRQSETDLLREVIKQLEAEKAQLQQQNEAKEQRIQRALEVLTQP